jgi:hypothetical protein
VVAFIPEKPSAPVVTVPYFEDITAKDVPGRWVEKPILFYQKRIEAAMAKLGAFRIVFTPGEFPGTPRRAGFQIAFVLNGIPGRIDCAALPLRRHDPKKKDRALAQALYLVAIWLEAEASTLVWRPGAIPLVPFLIGNGGLTVTEELVERRVLPAITPFGLLNGGG